MGKQKCVSAKTSSIFLDQRCSKWEVGLLRGAPDSFRGLSEQKWKKYDISYQKEITQNNLNVCDLMRDSSEIQ